MAGVLGHKVAEDHAGADAYDEIGECEYKSTIGKNIQTQHITEYPCRILGRNRKSTY